MPPVKSIIKILSDRNEPATLSPIGDLARPNSLLFNDARAYEHLFSGHVMNRSPRRVRRKGLFYGFLRRSSLLKMEMDVAQGFDVSIVLYPLDMDLPAWGIAVDRVGRVFEVTFQREGLVEFSYQGGGLPEQTGMGISGRVTGSSRRGQCSSVLQPSEEACPRPRSRCWNSGFWSVGCNLDEL